MAWHPKVVVLGAYGCGKTSLVRRWVDGEFTDAEGPTLGVNPRIHHHVQLWDTSGQDRFRALSLSHLKDARAVLFVYSIANRASFDELRDFWIPAACKALGAERRNGFPFYLVGTKLDLEEVAGGREVEVPSAVELAATHDAHYSECSAKTGHGIDHVGLFLDQQQRAQDTGIPSVPEQSLESALDEHLQELEAFPLKKERPSLFRFLCCCCCPWRTRRYKELQK